ncbi:MAG TPA: hypothetical protein VIR98_00670 [Candidatus Paceibacterota bacterium]
MKTEETIRPHGFISELADTARTAYKPKSPAITAGRGPSGSIRIIPYGRGVFRVVIFTNQKKDLEEYVTFTQRELNTAFGIGDDWLNDSAFALEAGAEYGIKDLFVRTGNNLVLFVENREICIRVSEEIRGFIKRHGW